MPPGVARRHRRALRRTAHLERRCPRRRARSRSWPGSRTTSPPGAPHQVLDAWQADCADRVAGSVGSRRDVAVSTGVGRGLPGRRRRPGHRPRHRPQGRVPQRRRPRRRPRRPPRRLHRRPGRREADRRDVLTVARNTRSTGCSDLRGRCNGHERSGTTTELVRRRSRQGVVLPGRGHDGLEDPPVERGALAADGGGGEDEQPVEPYLAGSAARGPSRRCRRPSSADPSAPRRAASRSWSLLVSISPSHCSTARRPGRSAGPGGPCPAPGRPRRAPSPRRPRRGRAAVGVAARRTTPAGEPGADVGVNTALRRRTKDIAANLWSG